MDKIIAAFLVVFLCLGSGCATFQSKLPVVIAAVQDGTLVVDSIEAFASAYFVGHPDAAKQKLVSEAIAKAKAALDAALRIANGAGDIDQAKIDEAFTEFRTVYTDLVSVVGSIGVKFGGAKLAAAPGGLNVPEPLAIKLKL